MAETGTAPGAETAVSDDFVELTDHYRRELLAHCYRMLGSVHEAEDLVQETYLRGWRAYHSFEGRSSLRTWLYRIATNACLNALDSRSRRPLPTGLGSPSADPTEPLVADAEVPWLEPVPDDMVGATAGDPAAIVTSRESVRLALVGALQHLPPRQRAVLLLREVLAMPAAEVAEVLDTTVAGVNSALQRARATLDRAGLTEADVVEPAEPELRRVLDTYATAMERKDIPALVSLFTADAVWEMPPFVGWYEGGPQIGRLTEIACPAGPGGLRLLPTGANGQPAFGMYMLADDGLFHAFQLHVLTVSRTGISHVAAFHAPSLFPLFDLPMAVGSDGHAVPVPRRS